MKEIKIPERLDLVWLMQNEATVIEALRVVVKLRNIKQRLEAPSGPPPAGAGIVESEQDMILPLPIQFSAKIAAPSGGGTVDTEARAVITLLLIALTRTGMNPSA
jgi:hypothetical protein